MTRVTLCTWQRKLNYEKICASINQRSWDHFQWTKFLLYLVKMIEHGPDIKSQLENDRCKSDLTTAQLLMFNYHPNINKRAVNSDILLSVKLHFLFIWGCSFMPKYGLPTEEPREESIFVGGAVMVNSKPPHKRLKLMRIMSACHIKSQTSKCSRVDIIFE